MILSSAPEIMEDPATPPPPQQLSGKTLLYKERLLVHTAHIKMALANLDFLAISVRTVIPQHLT